MPTTTTAPDNTASIKRLRDQIEVLKELREANKQQVETMSSVLPPPMIKALRKALAEKLKEIDARIKQAERELSAKITATDLVNQEHLDKLKDAAKDAINGNKDEALDKLEETGKDIVTDKVKDVIDDKIKDSDHADILKDVVDEVREGDLDGVVDVVKDGVKDEAGELIDKHIKDEKVAALIKEVVEGVVEGEFEDLLEVIADGVVDIIEDKLVEFIQHLLKLLEERIYARIEEKLTQEVGAIIDKAADLAAKELGVEFVANLIKNVAKRLMNRSLEIIREEIQILSSEQTIRALLGVLKDAAMKTLATGLKGRKVKDILLELLTHAEQHPEFKKIIRDTKERLARKFLEMAKEEAKRLAGDTIDAFLRVYGGWTGSLLDIARKEVSVGPWWGCVYAELAASAKIVGSYTTQRQGIGAMAHGQLSGNAYVGVGLRIGYDLPIVGDVSIRGGVEGGPSLSASLEMALEAKSSVIHASLAPFTLDAAFKARLYLETPIPNRILKFVPAYVTNATVVDQNILYPLGKVNLLVIKIPKYNMTFSMKTGKFAFLSREGDYHIEIHPTVKAMIKQVKESIEKAADEALSYLDPTNYDLNPFDSEGWIGRHF